MTVENKALDLNDAVVQKAIQEAAQKIAEEEAGKTLQEKTEGLLNKNKELLVEKDKRREKHTQEIKDLNDKFTALTAITSKYDFDLIDEQLAAAEQAKIDAMTAEEKNVHEIQALNAAFSTEKETLETAFDKFRGDSEAESQELKRQLVSNLLGNEVHKGMSEHGGISKFLEPHISRDTQIIQDDDGKFVPRIVKDGAVVNNSDGTPLSVSDYVLSFKEDKDFSSMFKSSGASGGDAQGNNDPTPVPRVGDGDFKRSKMSASDKAGYISEHGSTKYLSLPL